MKKLIISLLIGLSMLAFTGCINNNDAETDAKCDGATKCSADKVKAAVTKCETGKCGEGKCGDK